MGRGACDVRVVSWETHQHYRDRNPPWIKLHNSLLEDPVMAALPDATKGQLMSIWLLASRLDNKIPGDAAFIGKRINATTKVDLMLLIRMGFLEWACGCLQHASNPLASCSTETERETEQSRERAETEQTAAPPELVVFRYWQEAMGHPDAKFSPKRKAAVKGRLADGYTVEQLKCAVDGCRASPWHQGANERNRPFDDLELICRTGEKVEQFMGLRTPPPIRAAPSQKVLERKEQIEAGIVGGLKRNDRWGMDSGNGGPGDAARPRLAAGGGGQAISDHAGETEPPER